MKNSMKIQAVVLIGAALTNVNAYSAVPVIPGANGFGIYTPAGRGGAVYRVTNLASNGAGSLQACIGASGPRVCVFEVSGVIRLDADLHVQNPYLTIAGQTAPAPGIMLRGAALHIQASDVLVQHVTVRAGDEQNGPAPSNRDVLRIDAGNSGNLVRNVVIDHCSFSWGIDENMSAAKDWDNVTLSNSIVAEPLRQSLLDQTQGYTALAAAIRGRISFIGNLFAHSVARNPLSRAEEFVFVNNVVYNAMNRDVELQMRDGISTRNSIVGNVFRDGPDSPSGSTYKPILVSEILSGAQLFVSDNAAKEATSNPWSVVENTSTADLSLMKSLSPPTWPTGLLANLTADNQVLNRVLENAGSRPAERNAVDARVVREVREGSGGYVNCVAADGSERCVRNAGGWPTIAQNTRVLKLPNSSAADDDGDGYTNLEEFLHAMARAVENGGTHESEPTPPADVAVE